MAKSLGFGQASFVPPARPRSRWLVPAALAVVVLVVLIAIKPLVRVVLAAEARSAGLTLDYDGLELGWGSAALTGVVVSPTAVRGLVVRVDRVDVDFNGLAPSRVRARNVEVVAEASVFDLVTDLSRWASAHPTPLDVPISAPAVRIQARDPGAASWLVIEQGVLTAYQHAAVLRAPKAMAGGVAVDRPIVSWVTTGSSLMLGYGNENPSLAPVRLDVTGGSNRSSRLTLRDVSLADLGLSIGMKGAITKARVDGTLDLSDPTATTPLRGALRATVRGLSIAHPRELDSVLATEAYGLSATLEIPADHGSVHITDGVVTVGALKLAGSGDIVRGSGYATAKANLRGALSCAAIVRSAATADLGKLLGGVAGTIAGGAIGGEVSIDIAADADTRDPSSPHVRPTVGVGCGLRL
jgi:hypothetical protein